MPSTEGEIPLERCPEVLIFDLSEVLIRGLYGIEEVLHTRLGLRKDEVLPRFGGDRLIQLFLGELTEDAFLNHLIERECWSIETEDLKVIIRENLKKTIPGTRQLIESLIGKAKLVLLSDHAPEWASFTKNHHDFWGLFDHVFFSFLIGATKTRPGTFRMILEMLAVSPESCIFIDDRLQNVLTARTVGIPSFQFRDALDLQQLLHRYGV